MKILISTLFLQYKTGSETYTGTLARALRDRGHQVTLYTHNFAWYGQKLKDEGFEVWQRKDLDDGELPHTDFDVVHFQHNETVRAIYDQVCSIPKIFLSHGILPQPEQPPDSARYPMDGYAGVSEETLNNVLLKVKRNEIPKIILRNLIDTEHYKSSTHINTQLKNVTIISNYMCRQKHYIDLIKKACEILDLNLEILGDSGKRVNDTRPYIDKTDLVVGLGRCAYESMSMGRNVLVFDYQGMDGMVNDETYPFLRVTNLSGRCKFHKEVTLQDVFEEFERYSFTQGLKNRDLILKHHDSKEIAQDAENFYKTVICQKKS